MKLSHLSLKQVHLALQVLRSLLLVITLSFKELNLFLLHADFFILVVNESHKVLLVRFQVAQGREFLLFSTFKHQEHLVFGGLQLRLQVLIFSLKFLHSLSNLFRRVSNNFVHINSRLYLLRFWTEIQSFFRLLVIVEELTHCANYAGHGVARECLLKYASEFWVSEVNELILNGLISLAPCILHTRKFESQHLDHPWECKQALVNIGAFPETDTFALSLAATLRTCQVNQIYLRGLDDISTSLQVLFREEYVNFEDGMGTGAFLIQAGFSYFALLISLDQVMHGFFQWLHFKLREPIHNGFAVLILAYLEVLPVRIEQIIHAFIVDFYVRHLNYPGLQLCESLRERFSSMMQVSTTTTTRTTSVQVMMMRLEGLSMLLVKLTKDSAQWERNNSWMLRVRASHGIGLARCCLTVGEDSHIKAF